MRAIDKIVVNGAFLYRGELSKNEFYKKLGRLYLRSADTDAVANDLAKDGLIKKIKRNNAIYFQKID